MADQIQYERVNIKDHTKKGEELERMDLKNIAGFIARNNWDTPTCRATLQSWIWGPGNADLREALVESTASYTEEVCRAMLRDGAIIHKAVHGQDIVGIVVVIKLIGEFELYELPAPIKIETEPERPVRQSDTSDKEWWDMVEKWGSDEGRGESFKRSLRASLNHHSEKYKRLWEISHLGVAPAYRKQGIGSTLMTKALSDVHSGDFVILLAEPDSERMYQRIGFSVSSEQEEYRFCTLPQRDCDSEPNKFPIMTLKK
ncbi:hypothetical protein F5B20DRAFT_597399 [Whalleya microplaca]|nr:hypothetical protein F5B20DRAFT_597399 [Whalleya microplaca]